MENYCLLKKTVDRSVLKEGFAIPSVFHELFFRELGFELKHGESKEIKLLVDGIEYPVKITNTGFDRRKFEHIDQLQIRYPAKSALTAHFNDVFSKTAAAVREHYANRIGTERFKPKPGEEEYIAVYSTPVKGSLLVDCIQYADYQAETQDIRNYDEVTLESMIDHAPRIEIREGKYKVRKLTKAIGDTLKRVYQFRCQICGEYIGEKYGSTVIHAHHIDYFVKSLNNNADNILIVCPNHHSVIHDRNPVFIRSSLKFKYPNGFIEGLALNKHL